MNYQKREIERKRENGLVLRSQKEHSVLFKPLHEKATDLTWNYVNATGTILFLNQTF